MSNQLDIKKKACVEVFNEIKKQKINDQEKLNNIKKKISKKYKLKKSLTNIEILNHLSELKLPSNDKKHFELLITKPTRTQSGVAVVAIMSYPFKCPHGKCTTCPGGPDSSFGDVPQSYTGHEPATMRAIRHDFDPYVQVFNRLEQYVILNQSPQKVELIVMGGTFPSYDKKYQREFIKNSFQAMNDFSKIFYEKNEINRKKFNNFFELPGNINDEKREKRIKKKIYDLKKKRKTTLKKEQKKNEKTKIRCVGLTLETRPDFGMLEHGNHMLELGCTRVELGIQSIYENALKNINRGHSVIDSIQSISILRDLGFKLNFHYMPGLPGITPSQDLKGMIELFENENFRPDMIKIYPCMVLKGTKLYDEWIKKRYKPLTTKKAANLIADFIAYVPSYCRIMRVQRDIPTKMTIAGVDKTNLRQYIDQICKEKNIISHDIRSREPNSEASKKKIKEIERKERKAHNIKPEILTTTYNASSSKEYFISIEDKKNNILFGFLRLRFPHKSLRKEISTDSTLIRELHIYGSALDIGSHSNNNKSSQHKGYGKLLLKEAEKIAKMHNKKKIVIISGIGVRDYYRKQGYRKQGPYMIKTI